MTDTVFDLEAIEAELNVAESYEDMDGNSVRSVYIGTVFSLLPSGKCHMPWTTNATDEEREQDAEWYERAETELDTIGAYLESGEGDPCDLYVVQPVPGTEEEET